MAAGEYLGLLTGRAREVLDLGRPPSYPLSLATVTRLAFDRLRAEDPAAADLAAVCAFLAPEPVPADWFPRAANRLARPAGRRARTRAWRKVMARIGAQALARLDQRGLVMHRLTQTIVRGLLPPDEAAAARVAAEAVLAANHPGDEELPSTWPGWAQLLPHLLAADPDTTAAALSDVTYDAAWYLIRRGDARGGYAWPAACTGSAWTGSAPTTQIRWQRPPPWPPACEGWAARRGAGAGCGHPGPAPPGAGRGSPRHAALGPEPRRRPASAGRVPSGAGAG